MSCRCLLRLSALAAFVILSAVACGEDVEEEPLPGFVPLDDPEPGNWVAFRANPARTGHNPDADTGTTVRELWRLEGFNSTDYGAAKGSPSIYDDMVYAGSDTGEFVAVDRMTGELLWETFIDGTTQGIHGSPAISRDMVYIGAYDGTLYAYDRMTGQPQWDFNVGFQVGASPVVVPEHGRVYNTHERSETGGGHVVAVDARTGEKVWVWNIRAHPHSSVAIHIEQNRLVVGDNLALLHGFDMETGEKVWQLELPQPNEDGDESDIKSTPTILEDKNLVVVGAWSKFVHAYNVEDGALEWEYYAGARIMSSAAYAPGRGVVYVGSLWPGGSIHAIDSATGEELWTFQTNGSVMSSPAVSGDESLVVCGSHDGHVYALDAETGEEVWSYDLGTRVTGSPSLVGSQVYVTAFQGDLVALETGVEP